MRRMKLVGIGVAAALACAACRTSAAGDLAIQSFDGTGRLTFSEIPTATVYRVEWANAPTGAWHTGAPGATGIVARGFGLNAATVGVAQAACFYRVVASVTNAPPPATSVMVLVQGGTLPDIGNGVITVSSFYIGTCEVTWAEWKTVRTWAATNGYDIGGVGAGSGEDQSVQTVNWHDCAKWCNARSQKEGRTPVYYTDVGLSLTYKTGQVVNAFGKAAADGYRLPTDADWEFAARGGTQSQGYQYSGGNDLDILGWYFGNNSPLGTKAVGRKAANELGLLDMSGNVWEWCFDWNPGDEGRFRVRRGGCWAQNANLCQTAYRSGQGPDYRSDTIGFRAVLPAGP